MDLKDYQSQIKELILAKNDPYFNDLFNNILANESTSDKFLIKMELSRLSKPCQRVIDLRGKVQQECQPFTYDNTLHYLDEDTKTIFEKSIKLYDKYTIGAFEEVINHHLKMKKEQQNKKTSLSKDNYQNKQCELISLSETNKRAAPRMFFVSDIEIEFADGRTQSAQTTNISISGLKIKLKDIFEINNNEIIRVSFPGLKKEFTANKTLSATKYQIVGQDIIDDMQYIYLNYIDNDPKLIAFIQEFIRANQYKYKIDVYYYYELAKNKLLTNYYLANAPKLAVALDCKSSSPFLFALENNQNKEMISYWVSSNENNLHCVFNESRLLNLLDTPNTKIKTIIYSFTYHNNGICYYLSATEEELLEKKMKTLFIRYGANKKSWRIYHLSLTEYHHKNGNINSSLPQQSKDRLNSITHLATLEDITQSPQLSDDINKQDLNELNQFVHHNANNDLGIYQLFPVEQRQETRYLYKSNILVGFNGNNYPAQILSLSLSGLMIKLEAPLTIAAQSTLIINLIDLQKVSQKFSLSNLRYDLVHYSSESTLHLQVADKETEKIAKRFFSLLIKHNPTHFQKVPTRNGQLTFADELKKIESESHFSCALFVEKEKHLFNIKCAAIDDQNKPLKTLFTLLSNNANEINITPIINNQLYRRLISQPLHSPGKKGKLKEALIYVKTSQDRNKKWKIKSYIDEDFKNVKERNSFIEYTKANTQFSGAQFYILHYRLTSLDRPDFSIIQQEMDAISRFAMHLSKKLQEELQAMSGLIEITDCTEVFEKLYQQK